MGIPFSDITLYTGSYQLDTSEYRENILLQNFVSDLYVVKMKGYKPPGITRITIQPAFHNIWDRAWKSGSILSIAPFFSHEKYVSLDKKEKYKYVLDIIQEATLQLSDEYKWDRSVFEEAYTDVIESDFQFKLLYPSKTSRDRKNTGQVMIEKTEELTVLSLLINTGSHTKTIRLFEKRIGFGMI